jgi:hypothetical protein
MELPQYKIRDLKIMYLTLSQVCPHCKIQAGN